MKDHGFLAEALLQKWRLYFNTLKKFCSFKSMKKVCGLMFAKGLIKTIKKFEETGSFEVKSGRGRKLISSTSVEDVAIALHKETSNGVQTWQQRELPDL